MEVIVFESENRESFQLEFQNFLVDDVLDLIFSLESKLLE